MIASLPLRVLRRLRYEGGRAARAVADRGRHAEMLTAPRAPGGPHVFYGHEHVPGVDEVAYGGMVKFQLLAHEQPNVSRGFDVLYLGSSSLPHDAWRLALIARRTGAKFVWNQNGVAYPGWYGPGFDAFNARRAALFHDADHVFFQSAFCKVASDRFYGVREGPWEILHNPVDVERFVPAPSRDERPLTILLGGNQYQRYRFESALDALAELPDARLLVTGELSWARTAEREGREQVAARGLARRVELLGPYTQAEAPTVMRRADVLLHTKYNDPCPTLVLEAMACGLPVVYSSSGGTPELVGDDAGVGVQAPLDWERDHPPAGRELAAAVETVAARLSEYAAAARARALRFDARRWVDRHRAVFRELTS